MFIDVEKFKTEPENSLAILVIKTSYGTNHTGILVKTNGEIKFYHLAWHLKLECSSLEQINSNDTFKLQKWVSFSYFTSSPYVIEYRLLTTIKLLDVIYRQNIGKIPYGLKFRDTQFTQDNHLLLGEGENGLTCATFVLSFFQKVGIPLVDLNTWQPRVEDAAWKKWVIGMMIVLHVPEAHIQNVEKEELNYRLKPEEIAVSSSKSWDELPADFTFCSIQGQVFNTYTLS